VKDTPHNETARLKRRPQWLYKLRVLRAWFVLVKFFLEALLLRDSDLECGTLSNSGFKGLDGALILLHWK
jgi:hypothetical protein